MLREEEDAVKARHFILKSGKNIFLSIGDKTYSLDKTAINYETIFRAFNVVDDSFNYLST